MSTKFFTNNSGNSLIKKFNGAFEHLASVQAFHAVVGYFRASGYFAIREKLLKVPEVKILVGINVDKLSAEAKKRGLLFFGDADKAKDEFVKEMTEDIKSAGYTKDIETGILLFLQDIIDEKIKIRVHKTKKLHAKIYIFLPDPFNEYSGGEVITGSSNLTDAGLGVREESNYEFNVALRDFDDVQFAENEFQKLWEEGEEILPFEVDRVKMATHVSQLFSPYEIYLKLLIEYFGKSIDYDPDSIGDLPLNFKKLSYQVDAVNEGYNMLLEHNGFMLADVVGLGKTVIAALVAKRFLISNGSLNTKILVVYPPAVEKNWKATFMHFGLDRHTKFVTNGSLHKILNRDNHDYWPKEDYDLVLVDEAHKFRNHTSSMFQQLQEICKCNRAVTGNVDGIRKKVILISATPLNNRPEDIYYQLQLFQNARKSTLSSEPNLQSFFGPLIKQYKQIRRDASNSGFADIDALRILFEKIRTRVLEPLTVRRTRTDIKKYPEYKKDLDEQGVIFPEIAAPQAIEYHLNAQLEELFYTTIDALVDNAQIGYYRYQAIAFLKHEVQERNGYTQAELISRSLAYIMKTSMVKRLESSFFAFKKSLHRLHIATERMIAMFEKGKVYIMPGKNLNELIDKGYEDEQIEELIAELSIEDPRNQVYTPDDFEEDFIERLRSDSSTLKDIYEKWDKVNDDPKLDEFYNYLNNQLFIKKRNPKGKLIVFTESKETAKYLSDKLKGDYQGILQIDASNRNRMYDTIRANFDANIPEKEQKDDYNIIITTEVLAEGVNLHRANIIVNYDTPWNASRLMQRLGRVNRIGSASEMIYNYSFYPSRQSSRYVRLYQNAFIKLQSFHSAYGEDSQIYSTEEVLEQVKLHTQGIGEEEDRRLEHLRVIRAFKSDYPKEFRKLQKMPLKARTGRQPIKGQHDEIHGTTLVFMKSPYKSEFYSVDDKHVHPLTFLQAADLFQADKQEDSLPIEENHYIHIAKAEEQFEQEILTTATDSTAASGKDAYTARGQKFLRERRAESHDEKLRDAATSLIELLEAGTITSLPKEIRKLEGKYDKGEINEQKTATLVFKLVAKYGSSLVDDEETNEFLPEEAYEKPQVIISETFTL